MKAMKNLFHGSILALWALMGAMFTLKVVFGGPFLAGVLSAGTWWIWFAAFAAVTTLIVRRFEHAAAALAVHGVALLILLSIPRLFPLDLLRLGLDLISRNA